MTSEESSEWVLGHQIGGCERATGVAPGPRQRVKSWSPVDEITRISQVRDLILTEFLSGYSLKFVNI